MRLKQNHNYVLDNFHKVLKEAYKQIMGKMVNKENWLGLRLFCFTRKSTNVGNNKRQHRSGKKLTKWFCCWHSYYLFGIGIVHLFTLGLSVF